MMCLAGRSRCLPALVCVAFVLAASGCRSVYYQGMELFGYEKRDLLVDRVEAARDSQTTAKDQFQTALERFKTVLEVDGGELEAKYNELNSAYERSEAKARAVTERIGAVENVAGDLFREWEAEIEEYGDADLRAKSRKTFDETRARYEQVIGAMRRAEEKMPPVLTAFKDRVLYLKHQLNAQAIASLRDELVKVETNVESLIAELEAAIAEADAFISSMEKDPS